MRLFYYFRVRGERESTRIVYFALSPSALLFFFPFLLFLPLLSSSLPIQPNRPGSDRGPPDPVVAVPPQAAGAHVAAFLGKPPTRCLSLQDLDDEPGALRRSAARSMKRSRIAKVRNLSERRRRDRINEKMRALQELIPNCNKIDKASMLEEAIEYLKTLQLQVQMMSMGTGLCVPPMLLPAAAMQHLQMPPMAHFLHLSAMGLGFGMGAFDMVPLPGVAGAQFPCPMIPGAPMAMPPGSATVPMFGLPGQAMPSLASFPPAPGHMANNAVQAEQMPSEAATRGGADAGDHSQFPVVPQACGSKTKPGTVDG